MSNFPELIEEYCIVCGGNKRMTFTGTFIIEVVIGGDYDLEFGDYRCEDCAELLAVEYSDAIRNEEELAND